MKTKFSLTIGFIIIFVLGLFIFACAVVLDFLYSIFSPILFGDNTILEYAEMICYLVILAYIIGRIGQIKVSEKSVMKGIPLIGVLLGQLESIREIMSGGAVFVRVLDYPSPGHNNMGLITGKQIWENEEDGTETYSPIIYIPSPPNPFSGNFDWPAREKIQKVTTTAGKIWQILFTFGLMGPERLRFTLSKNQNLDCYYNP